MVCNNCYAALAATQRFCGTCGKETVADNGKRRDAKGRYIKVAQQDTSEHGSGGVATLEAELIPAGMAAISGRAHNRNGHLSNRWLAALLVLVMITEGIFLAVGYTSLGSTRSQLARAEAKIETLESDLSDTENDLRLANNRLDTKQSTIERQAKDLDVLKTCLEGFVDLFIYSRPTGRAQLRACEQAERKFL